MRKHTLGFAVLLVAGAYGQTFEVATIKPTPERAILAVLANVKPPCSGGPGSSAPLRLSCSSFTLQRLIEYAYDVKPSQIESSASLEQQRFDLVASVPEGAKLAEVRAMMQNLLAQRFHLVVERARKVQPIYRLSLARGGFKREPIAELSDEKRRAAQSQSQAAFMKHAQERIEQGDSRPWTRIIVVDTVEKFIEVISKRLDRPLANETGLMGIYDFEAEFLVGDTLAAGPAAPDMFAALQEQLGLKLARAEVPLDIVIVKSASTVPEEN